MTDNVPKAPTARLEPTPDYVIEAADNLTEACHRWTPAELDGSSVISFHDSLCNDMIYGSITGEAFWAGIILGCGVGIFVVRPFFIAVAIILRLMWERVWKSEKPEVQPGAD